jgi:hypothetical protein
VAIAIQDRSLHKAERDGRQRPLRPGVVHVSSKQLEFRVEVVLDAAERREPVPSLYSHLVDCVGIPPVQRSGRVGLQRVVGRGHGGGEPVQLGYGPAGVAGVAQRLGDSFGAGASTATTV